MNFQDLIQKASPYLEKMNPYVDKAKEYTGKALDFTQKQLQNTPIVLKNVTEYEGVLALSKRLILIGYDENDAVTEDITLRLPVWSTLAWSDNAALKCIAVGNTAELANHLNIKSPVDMRVYYGGREMFRFTDIIAVKNWWADRCYIDEAQSSELSADAEPPTPENTNKS